MTKPVRRVSSLPRAWLAFASASALLVACSGDDAAAANAGAGKDVAQAGSPAPTASKETPMTASKRCKDDTLHQAICMIDLITADLDANYKEVGGGGISEIKAASSTSYVVSLPQEERIDKLTYEFEVGGGKVTLKSRTASTESF